MSSNPSDNLQAFINALPGAVLDAVEESCQLVENSAKRNAPVDDGILQARITHKVDVEEREGVVGSNEEYAVYVHEGTGIYAKEGRGRREVPWRYRTPDGKWHTTKGQKPQPFLQDAVDSNRQKILNIFKRRCGVEGVATRFFRGGR